MKKLYFVVLVLILAVMGSMFMNRVQAQSAANFLPPPIGPNDLGNLVVGRVTVPLSYPLYVDKYYLFTQAGVDGMMAGIGAKTMVNAEAMERISAMLDDYQANDPAAFAQSVAVHKIALTPWPGF